MPCQRPCVPAVAVGVALVATVFAVPAEAARAVFGSHFGVSYLTTQAGDDLLAVQVPGGGSLVAAVQPGLRLGALDDAGRSGYFVDLGLSAFNSSGSTLYGFQLSGTYQHHFWAGQSTSPYLNASVGAGVIGDDDETFDNVVYGIGLGMRIGFGHGHGAGRMEARIDFVDPEDQFELVTSYGARFGFDLYGGR